MLVGFDVGRVKSVRERAPFFFALLPPGDGRFAFENRREFMEENGDEFLGLQQSLTRLGSELENLPSKPEEVFNFSRRAQELQVQLGFLMESQDHNTVFWIERRRGGRDNPECFCKPRRSTWRRSSELASSTSSNARYSLPLPWRSAAALNTCGTGLGLEHARETVLPSHFDYENQALFYVPPIFPIRELRNLPPKPQTASADSWKLSRGRAFVLFTSYAQMNDVYQRLLGELEFPMLLQGDAPKTALLEEFRLTPHAVLFATSSFWQGVDVQGEQLSCVIIDRLPFAVPSDPVVAARVKVH